jgi:hypothetical protein
MKSFHGGSCYNQGKVTSRQVIFDQKKIIHLRNQLL